MSYLEESFLIRKLYNFARSRRKVERKLKKYYPAIISVELLFKEDSSTCSRVFEWLIANQLKAEFFWRDTYKNEVDIILIAKKPIPLEIKYWKIDYKGLLTFMKKFNVNEGYIISYNKEEKQKINGETIYVIPAYKFLLNSIKLIVGVGLGARPLLTDSLLYPPLKIALLNKSLYINYY